jgi:hypothetical protein
LKAAIGHGRFQLTTDGLTHYRNNVPFAFGMQVDFAQLIKVYNTQEQTRYSPAKIISADKFAGSPAWPMATARASSTTVLCKPCSWRGKISVGSMKL